MTKSNSVTLGLVLAAAFAGTLAVVGAPAAAPLVTSAMATSSDLDDARCGKCGDNFCSASCGETATTCPRDCAGETSATDSANDDARCGRCGDNVCAASCETAASCPQDCGTAY